MNFWSRREGHNSLDELDSLLQVFLNELELRETKLLTWGFVDGGFSEEEINELAQEFCAIQQSNITSEELLDCMKEKGLLLELPLAKGNVWRTRMAESVRLFAKLRQIFDVNKWRISPTLVSDFRFSLARRTYPNRNITLGQLLEKLDGIIRSSQDKKVLTSLLKRSDVGEICLADFQVRATKQMTQDVKNRESRGMIVCAGTGTGKTLAFYLSALIQVVNLIKKDQYWTKVIAVYPRNELLKDQFLETYNQARLLDDLMDKLGKRKVLIGAFFGPALKNSSYLTYKNQTKWPLNDIYGYECPFLNCPKCGGKLYWRKDDVQKKKERIECALHNCSFSIEEDEIVLTRDRMITNQPDFLFTTTEMLNRIMSDSEYGGVIGIGSQLKPQMMLLDEVHTYNGIHGGQVAYLLRRWRHLIGKPVHFTGLSATLTNAAEFFAQLTGLNPATIAEISQSHDLIPEGMEYQLVLRGDPVSATSLLSTSIQTAMLLRRVLDPKGNNRSGGFYGQKVFAFTDDLDVNNRFYHNLLDAEGLNSMGIPLANKQPLAGIRSKYQPEPKPRMEYGQNWYLCEEIGHPPKLDKPLVIGRTSSQDTGVTVDADVIVATASLEVGFNDNRVGAIMQHKAPHDMASFLQRKGRAGRSRKMRPWTVVVLSDYGRDRLAYQNFDQLFDPMLKRQSLPLSNRYVLKMQATYSLLNWFAKEIPGQLPRGSIWNDISAPAEEIYKDPVKQRDVRARQDWLSEFIKNAITNEKIIEELTRFLMNQLSIPRESVQNLLWEFPRPIMTAVLPTIIRKLETNWQRYDNTGKDYFEKFSPAPEFIPQSLFSDLNLPEIKIVTINRGNEEELASMAAVQALRTFAPGRVSRRFGTQSIWDSHWIKPVALDSGDQSLPLESFCPHAEIISEFQYCDELGRIIGIPCYRPWTMLVEKIPNTIMNTSQAHLIWKNQIYPAVDRGIVLDIPEGTVWRTMISDIQAYIHNHHSCATVRRFALGSEAVVKFSTGDSVETRINFIDSAKRPISLGFSQEVDAIVFRFSFPEDLIVDLSNMKSEKNRALRTAYFRHCILHDVRLNRIANIFQRDWIFQVYFSSLTSIAMKEELQLIDAREILHNGETHSILTQVLDTIFQVVEAEEGDTKQKVHESLAQILGRQEVLDILYDLSENLWKDVGVAWDSWILGRFKSTLGGAILQACLQLSPQFDENSLCLDIDGGPRPPEIAFCPEGTEEIWITETMGGGSGVIEDILQKYAEDPRRFFLLVESALGPGDFELVDTELRRMLDLVKNNDRMIVEACEQTRASSDYQTLKDSLEKLHEALAQKGILTIHPVLCALNARILRPGSSARTDALLIDILDVWQKHEMRLGVEIDARIFAYIYSCQNRVEDCLSIIDHGLVIDDGWRFQMVYSLLWSRGSIVKTVSLSSYNPYSPLPDTYRDLVADILPVRQTTVLISDEVWQEKICQALVTSGIVRIKGDFSERNHMKEVLLKMGVMPVEVGFLRLFPRLLSLQRQDGGFVATFDLREAVQ